MSEINSIYFGKKTVQSIETKNGVLYGGGDPFEYEAVDGGYAVTGFKKSLVRKGTYPTNISIPESHNDQPVVEIGENAFESLNSLEQVFIPASVKRVKQFAFSYCYAIVTLDEACNFEFIGNNCFTRCSGFSTLRVNGTIEGTLEYFTDLTSVIGNYSFQSGLSLQGDTNLTSINLESVTSINGAGMQRVGLQEVNIPNCTNIGYRAFQNNTTVKTLYLSTSAIYFNSYCFYGTAFEEVHCKASDISRFDKTSFRRVYLIGNETTVAPNAFSNCRNLERLVINNGCLTLGEYMCSGCSALTQVVIPNSVTTIGNNSFYLCSSLTNITIPNSVTTIQEKAFCWCSGLTDITLPNSVTSIGSGAFSGCSSLVSVSIPFIGQSKTIPEDQPKYPFGYIFGINSYSGGVSTNQKYYDPDRGLNTTTYYLPSTLRTVTLTDNNPLPLGAFSYCRNITSINLPNNLIGTIEQNSFESCSSLSSIIIPEGITTIEDYAFSACSSLITVVIPNSIEEVGRGSFQRCDSLQYNVDNNAKYLGNENNRFLVLISATEKESITSCLVNGGCRVIVPDAFDSCSILETITISDSVINVGERAFSHCSSLTTIVVGGNNTTYDSREQCNAIIETASNKLIAGCPNTSIPNTVTSIGDYAFYELFNLTSITIPNSVTSIGESVFYNCGLTSITIPDSVTSIGKSTFKYCGKLESVTLSNNITKIEDDLFYYCSKIQSITIPNGVTSIGNYVFYWCTGLTTVVLPNSLISIGHWTFDYCPGLANLIIPDSVTSIGYRAFSLCGLTNVTIPGSAVDLGDQVFYSCRELVAVTISNGVPSIPNYMFNDCKKLKNITIPNSVTSIGSLAFSDCTSLTEISLPENLLTIGYAAFHGCSSLGTITIPDSVTSIDEKVFVNCNSLTTIVVGGNNTTYDSREQCNAIIETASNKLIAGCINTNIPNTVTSIGDYAFSSISNLTSITIPNSVTSIGKFAFEGCGLISITIPDSVTSIGDTAFRNTSLETVVLSSNLMAIPEECFSFCNKLTSVMIYENITRIRKRAFYYCSTLSAINYNGTMEQFQTITLYSEWKLNSGINTVHCTDGDITL